MSDLMTLPRLLAVILAGAAAPVTAAQNGALPVWPREAKALTPIPLAQLIAEFLPAGGHMDWHHHVSPRVRWLTNGIDQSTSRASRLGVARVRADATVSRVLRRRWEELAWTLELSTDWNAKLGPTTLRIYPGFDNVRFNGAYLCSGEGFDGCAFPMSALNSPKVTLQEQCRVGRGANQSIVMNASTIDGRRGTVVYIGSLVSGAYSNSVEVSTLTADEYCTAYRDRDY